MANDMFNQDVADDNQQSMDNIDPSNPSPAPSPLPMDNQINPTNNPYSNGTGSARPVFNQASQDAIGKINQGQQMGNMMLNNPQQGQLMNGASVKGIDPPKGNEMKSDNTSYMNNRRDINQMEGTYAGLERRESSDPDVNFSRMMNKDLAKTVFKDEGFYSDNERKRQAHVLGYDEVSHAGLLNKTGKTIAKGPEKPKAKPQSEMKMLRSVKGLEPKKKLMAAKVVGKLKKKPIPKMTPRPAKRLGASMDDGDNGYTYTTSESKASKKQKRKEARKERVTVRKTKVKKEYKNSSSGFLPSEAFKTKTKEVNPKRAARMSKRGFREAIKG